MIAELQHVLGAKHHFTAARCPWANGTIENAMKHVLKAFRALLSEWRMDKKDWRIIRDVEQMICNPRTKFGWNGAVYRDGGPGPDVPDQDPGPKVEYYCGRRIADAGERSAGNA